MNRNTKASVTFVVLIGAFFFAAYKFNFFHQGETKNSTSLASKNYFPDYTIFDHGKECFEAMDQTPLPPISCKEGTLLPVTQSDKAFTNEVPANCDKPSLVHPLAACVPGDRLKKVQNKDITTIYMCRRLNDPFLNLDIETGWTQNIAIIQYNRRTKNVCWFQIRKHDRGIEATNLVPPYEPDRIFGDAKDLAARDLYVPPGELVGRGDACIKCHDNQVWIRTPVLASAKPFGNGVPDTDVWAKKLFHVGKPFQAWNSEKLQPNIIKINSEAYDEIFPPDPSLPKVNAGLCTTCHYIGKSPWADEWEGTCGNFVRGWATKEVSPLVSRWQSHDAHRKFWMPPRRDKLASENEWRNHYDRAIQAAWACCQNYELRSEQSGYVCKPTE